MNKIFIIGSSNTDMVIKLDQLPLPGETRMGGNFFMNAGGKGANQAVAAARMGGEILFVTKIGEDIFGKQALEGFAKEGIDTKYVFTDFRHASGTALILVNDMGENCIAVAPGANAALLPADIDKVSELDTAEIILMQLEIPLETVYHVASKIKGKPVKLVINPAPAQKLDDTLLDGLFLVTPNETEAKTLTGISVSDEQSASEAAEFLLKKGVQHVIITLGSGGAYFQDKERKFKMDAPLVQAVDTTAAGDIFNGALVVALTENLDWEKAIGFAIHAASLSVTRLGAQSSAPYRREVNG